MTLYLDIFVSVKENSASGVTIYPNPVNNVLYLSGHYNCAVIYDIQGRELKMINGKSSIDISNFPKGIYLINIAVDNGNIIKKVVKE